MMKTTTAMLLIAFAAMASADLERIYDPATPDAEAFEIVRTAVESSDLAVVAALGRVHMFENARALGAESWLMSHLDAGSVPMRDYGQVPGLKEFLIDHWRESHAASGFNADYDANTNEPWKGVPGLLSRFYPGDPGVHALIWQIVDTDATPAVSLRMMALQWLNVGRFTTHEADAYRMNVLVSETHPTRAYVNVGIAARGLALARRPEALGWMIDAWRAHPLAGNEIAVAVASYPTGQLSLHAEQLRGFVDKADWRELGSEAVKQAMTRIEAALPVIDEH